MTFPKLSGFIHFSKTFPGLENAVLKFHDFSRFFMTVRTLRVSVPIPINNCVRFLGQTDTGVNEQPSALGQALKGKSHKTCRQHVQDNLHPNPKE